MSRLAIRSQEAETPTSDLAPPIREIPEDLERVYFAIGRANSNTCPSNDSNFIFDESTGRAFAASCDRWSCPVCSHKKVALWSKVIEDGLQIANGLDDSYQHFVLEPTLERIDPQGLKSASRNILDPLKGRYEYRDYALAVEMKISEGPALNLITIGGAPISQDAISDVAKGASFNPKVEMPQVARTSQGALDLSYRMTASSIRVARWAKDHRLRGYQPVSLSRSWKPCGYTKAKQRLFMDPRTEDNRGPYYRVRVDSSDRVVGISPLSRSEEGSR